MIAATSGGQRPNTCDFCGREIEPWETYLIDGETAESGCMGCGVPTDNYFVCRTLHVTGGWPEA